MKDIQSSHTIMLPFRLKLDPMEKLLIANFKDDPEFKGIEPQVFDDEISGKGMRLLRYRNDGSVDVYWQPGVRVDRKSFTVGAGLRDFMETNFEAARFDITEHGVELHVAFEDAQGRMVKLDIQENVTGKASFPLLAPVGADIAKPLHFFLVYMPNFDFVRQSGTVINGQIGDRLLHPATLPILLQGKRVWFIRYCDKPIISSLNPPMERPVTFELQLPGSADIDGMFVEVDNNGGVTSLSTEKKLCEIKFSPAFPNLSTLDTAKNHIGKWSLKITDVSITGGIYEITKKNGSASIILDVLDHWKPGKLTLSVNLLTRVVRTFRTWPSTYRWQGTVEFGEAPSLSGKWERVRR